ncbi:MAG: S8 family serine peptidase [Cytophagales bacterium]|nr:S8 family serine peptidase [Cytophagales bacterium]
MKLIHNIKISCVRAILISFGVLFSSTVFSQTQSQRQQILTATNVTVLNPLAIFWDSLATQQKAEAEQWAIDNGAPVRDTLPDGGAFEIMRIRDGRPIYYVTFNVNAAQTVSTNEVWTGGNAGLNLDGSGVIIGEWDAAIPYANHQELIGNVIAKDPWGSVPLNWRQHATHVAGTMIAKGVDPLARGMASGAILHTYDWYSDLSEMTDFAISGYLLSNHSYGNINGWVANIDGCTWKWFGDPVVDPNEDYKFGFYSQETRNWDELAFNAPYYLIVQAAGNYRGDGPGIGNTYICSGTQTATQENNGGSDGYDCIPDGPGIAKNVLTVGGIDDIISGYSSPSDVVMYTKSSWGPTDDGRIKPDLVANATALYSSSYFFPYATAYQDKTGTSMASASVTGSLALLQQHYSNTYAGSFMKSATLKALVIHTADEAGSANGPDYQHGWGLLNTEKAANLITLDSSNCFKNIQELILNNNDTFTFTFDYDTSQQFIKATIVWNDPAGTPVADTLNPPDLMLVNDLDLRIIRQSDGQIFYPWTLDPTNSSIPADTTQDNFRDNVEQVYLSTPTSGTYIVKVTHKATLQGVNPQAFSMIISGGVFDLSQVRVKISPTHVLCIGDSNGTATVIACGGTPPYTYLWSNGQTNDTATGLAAGNYSITVTDTNGIMVTDSVTINEPPAITITMFAQDPFCNGSIDGFAQIAVTGGNPEYTFLWSTGETSQTVFPLGAGSYTVIVTDANGCTATDSATLIDPPVLIVTSSSATDVSCNGGSDGTATIAGTGGTPPYSYQWWDFPFTQLIAATNPATGLTAGTYVGYVIDDNGCYDSAIVTINEPTPVILSTTTTNALCNGVSNGTATVIATGGTPPYFFYKWFTTPPQFSATATGLAAGIYQVVVVDTNFCITFAKDTVFNDDTTLTISIFTTDEVCIGSANGTATATVIGGTLPYTFLWDDPLAQTDSIADSLSAGVYSVTVTDSNGCIITATDTVKLAPQPIAHAGTDTTIFCGDSVTFSAQTADTTSLYAWSPSSGLNDTTLANPIAFPVFTTQYVLTVTDTATGCIDSDTVIITVNPLPIADAGPDTNILCGDSIIIGPQVVDTTLLYSWSPVTGLDNATIPNPTAFPSITTSYILTVTDTAKSCINFASILITVGNPVAGAGPDITICRGDSITIGTQPFDSTFLFAWSPAAGLNDSTIAQPIASPDSTTAYLLTVTDTTTECVDYDTVLVSLPVFDFVNPVIDTIVYWQFGSFKVLGEVIIDSGGVLHMGWADFEFSYDVINELGNDYDRARIVIKPGGKLISNYDTLTGCGGGIWDGIEVRGDETLPQNDADQGVLEMNQSSIENAQIGILCGIRPLINAKFRPSSGGIVRINNSDFINNRLAVKMNNYPDFERVSYFNNCNFQYDAASPYEYNPFATEKIVFVHLIDTYGITFTDNTFTVDATAYLPDERGIAIKGESAGFNMVSSSTGNTFDGLTYAIKSDLFNSISRQVIIDGSTFNNVQRSIYIQGGTSDEITNNTFTNIPNADALGDHTYGVFLVSSSGFIVDGNTFSGVTVSSSSPLTAGSHGIAIENSGAQGGRFFDNDFEKTDFAVHTQGDNQNLKIRCNKFGINGGPHGHTAWYVFDGSLKQQGGANCVTDPSQAAGNQWMYSCPPSTERDIFTNVGFAYYANPLDKDNFPTTVPDCSTPAWKSFFLVTNCQDKTITSCDDPTQGKVNPGGCGSGFDQWVTDIKDLIAKHLAALEDYRKRLLDLIQLRDGGDKKALLQYIDQTPAVSAINLRNRLLNSLPLSDEVIKTVITRRPPLPPGMLKDVLIPNAPLNEDIMNELRNKIPPLPVTVMQDIENAQYNAPLYPKEEELKKQITWHEGEAILLENELIRELPKCARVPELKTYLHGSPLAESKKTLARLYYADKDFINARLMLDTVMWITNKDSIFLDSTSHAHNWKENQNFSKLTFTFIEAGEQGKSILTKDSTGKTITELDTIQIQRVREVCKAKVKVSADAELILAKVEGGQFYHLIKKGNNNIARLHKDGDNESIREELETQTEDKLIQIIPNPANEIAWIITMQMNSEENAEVLIYDIFGRIVQKIKLNQGTNQTALNTKLLKSGLYIYKYTINNEIIRNGKITIVK